MIDWYYSDPHFGHSNIIQYADRPFSGSTEQTQELIFRYAQVVDDHETVLWLGDCFMCSMDEAKRIMSKLPGRKGLVRGNHDRKARQMIEIGFDFVVEPWMFVKLPGIDKRVRACHFPYGSYRHREGVTDAQYRKFEGRRPEFVGNEYLLHGHVHSKRQRLNNMLHVGVDAWNYAPVHAETLGDLITNGQRYDTQITSNH